MTKVALNVMVQLWFAALFAAVAHLFGLNWLGGWFLGIALWSLKSMPASDEANRGQG